MVFFLLTEIHILTSQILGYYVKHKSQDTHLAVCLTGKVCSAIFLLVLRKEGSG